MRSSTTAKISTGIGTAALVLCLATASGIAAPNHPGPHPGGGPPPGGGAHFAPHINAAPRFTPHVSAGPRFTPHISAAPRFTPHVSAGPRFTPHISAGPRFHPHIGAGPRFHPHIGAGPRFRPHIHVGRAGRPAFRGRFHPHVTSHVTPSLRTHRTATVHNPNGVRNGANMHTATRLRGRPDPRNFARLRHFARDPAFRPFLGRHWRFHHHYGWIGPWFWPYAYGDFFYDALWPYEYAYYDPFWYYGYDDIYEGIFSPYDYGEYVQGPGAPARMNALTQTVAQSCDDEAAEVTGWPIDQIQSAVQPDKQQTALLDALGNAVVKASGVVKSHCPTSVAFTPTDRLAQMQDRLQGLVQAVDIVQPPLAKFYDSLSDEQKARFNDIGAPGRNPSARGKPAVQNLQSECGQSVMSFPADRIEQSLHLSDAQHTKLETLQAANSKAADLIKASCPNELPVTPPDRLAAEGKHLQAMLTAVQTIRPPLDAFYNSLSDEQKARFNNLGRQLFAAK